jgi:hypothetical protein
LAYSADARTDHENEQEESHPNRKAGKQAEGKLQPILRPNLGKFYLAVLRVPGAGERRRQADAEVREGEEREAATDERADGGGCDAARP